ncbi:MAG: alpha/beta hydrolase [Burkholderiales bacterium]|nr:alpha/beta hydrolase [Burkholderiales bacterium]
MSTLPECVEVATGSAPGAAVIWLHGLGADGYDFVPVVKELEVNALPGLSGGVRFVFPHAPMRPVTINGGMVMRAWYDIRQTDLGRQEDEAGLRESQAVTQALIEREVGRGITRDRIVLAGFSQGGAITLQAGLRQAEPLAGLMVLSSYLPLAATVAAEATAAGRSQPVFMAHGREDAVVVLSRARHSRDALAAQGVSVEWHDYAMEHSVCLEELRDIRAWLERVLT